MADSTLDPDAIAQSISGKNRTGQGHGAGALGPSDLSDTGSDSLGGPGLVEEDALDLDRGTDEEPDTGRTARPRLGDSDLDSATDAGGTGERISAGQDAIEVNQDIGFDRIVDASEAGLGGGLDQAEEAQLDVTDEELADDYRPEQHRSRR